ncbi:hypothetical protein M422DRAFT_253133 [Sphaerobolus stellatus SS14]|uniref:Uncharacterized protein n=1 Tax=Sphaerobolus stellatus (strain SS14) TaxID=990650 RepID=A0A0C9VXG2_SPHS4|nr:hypothetical protein M422DRAFT_253133 [Sphaerobolus stellatus SS14]
MNDNFQKGSDTSIDSVIPITSQKLSSNAPVVPQSEELIAQSSSPYNNEVFNSVLSLSSLPSEPKLRSIKSAADRFLGTLQSIYTLVSKIATADKDEKKAINEIKECIQYFERILSDVQLFIDKAADTPENLSIDYSELESCLKVCTSQLQEFVDKFKPLLLEWKGQLHHFKWPLKNEEQMRLVDLMNQYKLSFLNNLGGSLFRRFEQLGDITDLNESTLKFQEAVQLTPMATLRSHQG